MPSSSTSSNSSPNNENILKFKVFHYYSVIYLNNFVWYRTKLYRDSNDTKYTHLISSEKVLHVAIFYIFHKFSTKKGVKILKSIELTRLIWY